MKPGEEVEIGDVEEGSIVMMTSGDVYFVKGEKDETRMTLKDANTGKEPSFFKTTRFIFLLNPKPSKNLALSIVEHWLDK